MSRHTKTVSKDQYKILIIALMCVVALLIALIIVYVLVSVARHYETHAAPDSYLAGEKLHGEDQAGISSIATRRFDSAKIKLTLAGGGDEKTFSMADIGFTLDAEASGENVIKTSRETSTLKRILPFIKKETPIEIRYDAEAFHKLIMDTFGDKLSDSSEPVIAYDKDAKKFVLTPGINGLLPNSSDLFERIAEKAFSDEIVPIEVQVAVKKPVIGDEAATQITDELNTMVSGKINIHYFKTSSYRIPVSKLASWVEVGHDFEDKSFDIDIDKDKIARWIKKTLPGKLGVAQQPQIVFTREAGGVPLELKKGKEGRVIADSAAAAQEIADIMIAGKGGGLTPEYKDYAYKSEDIGDTDEKWAEVDLTTQKARLWQGRKLINEFDVSTGKTATPTITGAFEVYLKRSLHTMINYDKYGKKLYETPDVRWISYFHGAYAFHAAYWHNNFGHPMSHGCVNMKTDEAKIVYDFVSVGTKVFVHGVTPASASPPAATEDKPVDEKPVDKPKDKPKNDATTGSAVEEPATPPASEEPAANPEV